MPSTKTSASSTKRPPIINLRELVASRDTLHADISTLDASHEQERRRFLRLATEWGEGHKRELSEFEERHLNTVSTTLENVKNIKSGIETARGEIEKVVGTLEIQQRELRSVREKVSDGREERQKRQQALALLTAENTTVKAAVDEIKTKLYAEQKVLDTHWQLVPLHLEAYKRLLAISIDRIEDDVMQFRFTHIDPSNHAREFSFILDISQGAYRVPSSYPLLPSMAHFIERLNREGDFPAFVKRVRMAFVEYVRDERGP
ncbi:hypothetical protein DL93DRAFT_2170966 [Clavulina sp. PMI_390]|nr:hypothetical protein DL93DRAFT_2170966 [Clavulina sp. PMI_390]